MQCWNIQALNQIDQIKVLNNLHLLLGSLDIHQNKQIILTGDLNLFLDTTLEVKGGSPCLRKKSVAKLIKLTEIREHLIYVKTCFWFYTTKVRVYFYFK